MFKLFISFVILLLALALIACGGEKKAETKMEAESQTEAVVADSTMATCPGCGMTMEKEKMISQVVEGDTMYFCSEGCRDNYLANLPAEEEDTGTE